ncbi:SRPBCC family protein [Flagellimonas sp. 2504JD4-2]
MTNSVYLERVFDSPIQELFQWFRKPDLIAQWFGPKHLKVGEVLLNFRIGGAYSIELQKEHGNFFYITGSYIDILEPNKIIFDLKYKGLSTPPPDSVVKMIFEQIEPKVTKLSFVQKFDITPPDFETRTKAWESMFEKLYLLLK